MKESLEAKHQAGFEPTTTRFSGWCYSRCDTTLLKTWPHKAVSSRNHLVPAVAGDLLPVGVGRRRCRVWAQPPRSDGHHATHRRTPEDCPRRRTFPGPGERTIDSRSPYLTYFLVTFSTYYLVLNYLVSAGLSTLSRWIDAWVKIDTAAILVSLKFHNYWCHLANGVAQNTYTMQ